MHQFPVCAVPAAGGSERGRCVGRRRGGPPRGARARLGDAAQAPLHLLQQDVPTHVLRTAAPVHHLTRLAHYTVE